MKQIKLVLAIAFMMLILIALWHTKLNAQSRPVSYDMSQGGGQIVSAQLRHVGDNVQYDIKVRVVDDKGRCWERTILLNNEQSKDFESDKASKVMAGIYSMSLYLIDLAVSRGHQTHACKLDKKNTNGFMTYQQIKTLGVVQ